MNELALFAGSGGGILGGGLLGWRAVCAVEIDPFARSVLIGRQRDGMLPEFPIWDNICTFDGKPWRGKIDIVTGGFPCQDISEAGHIVGKRTGIHGGRSGLAFEMLRIVGEVRPSFVLAENSPKLRTRGLETILGELAAMGYDARWGIVGAASAGANHVRERMWIAANAISQRSPVPAEVRPMEGKGHCQHTERTAAPFRPSWWSAEPGLSRLDDGTPNRVDRTRCAGNGQVPAVVKIAWNLLAA